MRDRMLFVAMLMAGLTTAGLSVGNAAEPVAYVARDTLRIEPDESADARECLAGLVWTPGEFSVTWTKSEGDGPYGVVRFPSSKPTDDARNDLVALEWYAPNTEDGAVARAPAVVVVHESGSQMAVGRTFAKAIYAKGYHAFLIHLPHYGLRRTWELDHRDGARFLTSIRQAIADVRRARDAVAVIPEVESEHISLQGTSLGGFVAGVTAGLDDGYEQTFVMVAGGDLLGVINGGLREAKKLREMLAEAGYTGDKLKQLAATIEPTRLAHRIDPAQLWLYTAKNDQVVPAASALALKTAARLDDDHHIILWGDHYTAFLYFPVIVDHMVERLKNPPRRRPR